MSTLSELLPSGGGGSTVDFVASGTLPNGKPVILKADGTVEVVSGAVLSTTAIPAGSEYVFNSATSNYLSISFDPNSTGKFVIAYTDAGNSSFGTAVVGTVSGTTISFGSEYVFNASASAHNFISFDPNTAGKFVIAYRDSGNSYYGTAIVGTVSGTSISFGSEYVFNSGDSSALSISFDPNTAGKFVIAYTDVGNGYYGTAVVGTISGTTISFGSEYVFKADLAQTISISFDPNTAGKFVIAYPDRNNPTSNSAYGIVVVGTVSGTTISFGSDYVFNPQSTGYLSISFDPNTAGKFVIAYSDVGNGYYGTAIVGTVSGTTISFGSEYVFNIGTSYYLSVSFDPNTAGKFVVAYRDSDNSSFGTAVVGTVSGTTISFGSEYVFNSGASIYHSVSFDPNNTGKFVVAYKDSGNSSFGTAVVGTIYSTSTNLTTANFVGISDGAYLTAETATIAIQGGLSTNQTGLTIGSTYYAQGDGTISTVSTAPAINIGKALSATTLLLKDL